MTERKCEQTWFWPLIWQSKPSTGDEGQEDKAPLLKNAASMLQRYPGGRIQQEIQSGNQIQCKVIVQDIQQGTPYDTHTHTHTTVLEKKHT